MPPFVKSRYQVIADARVLLLCRDVHLFLRVGNHVVEFERDAVGMLGCLLMRRLPFVARFAVIGKLDASMELPFLRRRIRAGVLGMLTDKWLKAGMMEGGHWHRTTAGTDNALDTGNRCFSSGPTS